MERSKSRTLGIVDYYEALQVEWIVADLRQRIYTEPSDRNYYERVKFGKRETIEKISKSKNNKLPTIFDDEDYKHDLEQRVYRENSHPVFVYRDDAHRMIQEPRDLLYYYAIGSDVRCTINEEIYLGKIKAYTPYSNSITIVINDKPNVLSIKQVVRIL